MSNLSNFTKRWLTATCAPESIQTFTLGLGLLHKLINENRTKQCYVIEVHNGSLYVSDNMILKLATVLQKCDSKEAVLLAAELLGINIFREII